MQHYIQQEIGPHFKPPCALAENLSCILKMQISTGGALDDLDVVQSSGVTLFDLAAEHAVCQLTEFRLGPRQRIFNNFQTVRLR